jgi:hypothetical protein
VAQPILAGLGIYAFSRSEGLSRPAATTGGLVLALTMASAELATSLPFAGSLAWTAILLAAASRYVRSATWPGRLGWGALAALAWGQLAAAHFSVGLVFGTGALLTYLVLDGWRRSRERTWRHGTRALAIEGVLLVGLGVGLNMAYLLPRLAYLPRTDLSLAYTKLVGLEGQLAGVATSPTVGPASGLAWPLKLATFPGSYVGAIALLLSFAGLWSKRWRPLVIGFGAYGVVGYLLSLSAVAHRVPHSMWGWRLVDLYLHSPEWFGYVLLPVMAVAAAAGVDAWSEPRPGSERVKMIVPGVLVWMILPAAVGAGFSHVLIVLIGGVVAAAALALAAASRRLLAILPAILALELTITGVAGNHDSTIPFAPFPVLLQAVANPSLHAASFLQPGPMVTAIRAAEPARYMKLPRPGKSEPLPPSDVHGMIANHSLLFETEDTGTFNPVQPFRYWVFLRASQQGDVKYNRAYFVDPPPIALDLLQVGWIVAPIARPALPGTMEVAREDEAERWVLYRRESTPPVAQAVPTWQVVAGASGSVYPNPALNAVLDPSFDPSRVAVLEQDPGLGPSPPASITGPAATVSTTLLGDQALRVTVDTPDPVMLLVRTSFDPNWRADVDGHSAPVLRADYFLQAVAVPAGHHVVELRYRDPTIGIGLLVSALSLVTVVVVAAALRRRSRRGIHP